VQDTIMVKIAQRGAVVIPQKLRQAYDLKTGDVLTLLDLDGVFVLSRRISEVDSIADKIANQLAKQGETLESMLKALREVRERYDQK
jgi:bifunctional DNA-binding transcriptional regulator/antitoxin component of YhaV-PrlF toxin-antitoxin module